MSTNVRASFALPGIEQFAFKATHNSYQCTSGTNPIMNHPPDVQMDAFGVWALELDVGVKKIDGILTAVVGHNSPGDGICPGWGYRLTDFLEAIHGTRSLKYRPVFIYFEIKDSYDDFQTTFGDHWTNCFPDTNTGRCQDHLLKYQFAKDAVAQIFGADFIELFDFVDRNQRYPTVAEIVGKAVIYYPSPEFTPANPDRLCQFIDEPFKGLLSGRAFDACTERAAVLAENLQIPRVDQYQADWTFDYAAPPNPLVVASGARPPYPTPQPVGDSWSCNASFTFGPGGLNLSYGNADVSHGEIVAEQGTWSFPYKSIARAVTRAEGTTPPLAVGQPIRSREGMRAGIGWTVLIRPGIYRENFRIDFPLTLKRDTGDGNVLIVGQPGRTVRSLWITFSTKNEDKDADTGLLVQVNASNGRALGRFEQHRDKRYAKFHNHTEHLQLDGPIFETEMQGATLTVDISPNGSDAWEFDWQLDGTWSDGNSFSDQFLDISLDQDQTHYQKILSL